MKINVDLADPEEHMLTEIDARDRRAFERRGRKELGLPLNGTLQEVVQANPETYLTWLAWHSLVRGNGLKQPYAEFESRVLGTELLDAGGNPFGDPTATPR